jgi:hypothetical protein
MEKPHKCLPHGFSSVVFCAAYIAAYAETNSVVWLSQQYKFSSLYFMPRIIQRT